MLEIKVGQVYTKPGELDLALQYVRDGTMILRDSGGFIWWNEYNHLKGGYVLHGVASTAYSSHTYLAYGMAASAYLNVFTAEDARGFFPFTLVFYQPEEKIADASNS